MLLDGRVIEGIALFGDAEASIAIIVTSMPVVTTSVVTFCKRCVVWVVNIFLNEPLSMRNKFTDSDHASPHVDSTFAQLCFYRL
jgi:hypothetical protein